VADSGLLRRLAAPAYLIAGLLVVLPLLDFATNVWPPQPGQAVWRYGAVGLFSGFVLTPLLGLVLAMAIAAAIDQARALGVLGALSLVIAVAFVLGMGLFLLDAFQVRASVPPEGRPQFNTGIWRAAVKYVLVAAGLAWLGVAAARAGRHRVRAPQAPRASSPAVLHAPPEKR
jgi:hypothetical protein